MIFPRRGLVTAAFLVAALPAGAQSLGDLARLEEARRAASTSVRRLSNADLKAGEVAPVSPEPAAACYMSITEGRCVTAEQLLANTRSLPAKIEQKNLESSVRGEAGSLRSQIEKILGEIDTFLAITRNDSRSPGERKAADTEVARRQAVLANAERQWAKLETRVANMRLPHAWIEPVPQLSAARPQ